MHLLFIIMELHYLLNTKSILITIIGFCDDKYELSKIFRFVAQGIISCLTILSFDLALSEIIIWMIFFIFFINIYNFMDGIDGLAASQAIFILLCFSFFNNFYSINSLILYIIPIIIFLLYNVSPSKIFLGNTGSYLLGLLIAILIFNSSMRLSDIGFYKSPNDYCNNFNSFYS